MTTAGSEPQANASATTTTTTPTTETPPRLSPTPASPRGGRDGDGDGNGSSWQRQGRSAAGPRRGRAGIVAVLVVSLLLAGVARDWGRSLRGGGGRQDLSGATTNQSLANMNSFALALLLGGLRGPLVMVLWTQSETLKNEKNLEDFDTYVEWIRLLQPEFDTVHIFQVWNKAYNVSVQMASWANKYATILDAVEYARKVLDQRPGNINMVYAIASIYFDKLGGAAEKDYYKRRVREESLPHADKQKLQRTDPGWRPLKLDAILDQQGRILPHMLRATNPRPADLAPDSEWNTGAELQYLEPYQPFPYGASALALAYNYHKQAQVLQTVGKQRHANLSDVVVDSRPALALKGWAEDEWERGRRFEMQAFNVAAPTERTDMELPTAGIAVDAPPTEQSVLPQAIDSLDLGARVALHAVEEYQRHLRGFTLNLATYQSHIDSMHAMEAMMRADADYLRAMLAQAPADRQKLLDSAANHYRDTIAKNLLVILRYYTNEDLARAVLPQGMTRNDIDKLSLEQRMAAYLQLRRASNPQIDGDAEDRGEYERYLERAQLRLQRMGK
ncbi:MAG TPA: hypothetical protein VER17_10820 [Tepidisphaeraceae bacterium]|nr:hypothetical protein [Tepidisphaeraceae bacterium]